MARSRIPAMKDRMAKNKAGSGLDAFTGPSTPAGRSAGTPARQSTGKATFYLGNDVIQQLDDQWIEIRKKHRRRSRELGKSVIVDRILRHSLKDQALLKEALDLN